MGEVVVDRSDDGGDDQDLDERPHREGEEANDAEDDPERQPQEYEDADGLEHCHIRSLYDTIVGAGVIRGTLTNLCE
jgi:hypothetical protein